MRSPRSSPSDSKPAATRSAYIKVEHSHIYTQYRGNAVSLRLEGARESFCVCFGGRQRQHLGLENHQLPSEAIGRRLTRAKEDYSVRMHSFSLVSLGGDSLSYNRTQFL